ncbi:tetratricopeptide repeat protein [Pontibacter mangrovi]|uniref:Serpin family protein n=1 Tax=Pontibacter mangrovi TaxID=2589816 RepID=A0A501W679_9BACT|nr:serpin family protein [Pontibacter mangrovi]TPE44788.1 serpin family protein [Pontibacter mangrovi]
MKKAILFFAVALASFAVEAQNKLVFEEKTAEAYVLKYGTGSGSSQAQLNSIINILTQNQVTTRNGRPPRKPEFALRFEQQAQITDTGDKLQLKVQVAKVQVSGSTDYKGFEIGDALLPDKYKAKVQLLNAQDKVVQVYDRTVTIKPNGVALLQEQLPDTAANQSYKLQVVEEQVEFTAADVQQLREQLGLVRAYYAADDRVLQALKEVALVRPDDIDRLPLQDRKLHELEEQYEFLKKENYTEKLHLKQQDPQRLKYKMEQLQQVLQERRKAVNYTLATIHEHFYNRGLSLLNNGNALVAQTYFVKSVEANPNFAPAHVQLARIDLMNGYIREATNRIRDVLTRMRIDPQTEQLAQLLAQDIFAAQVNEGNRFTTRGEYSSALEAYAEARDLCSTIGGLRCNLQALNDGEARAANGVYRSMVESGKQLLSRNDLQEAERLAQEALGFQREYDYVLHNATEAGDLLDQVKFHYYLGFIEEGKRFLAQQNHRAALGQFEEALALEQRYTFRPMQELRQLSQKAAKPVLLAMLTDGYEQAMQNRLGTARQTAADATAMQERFALVQDAEVQSKYKLLRERIFTQECINTQTTYDKHYQNAQALVREKKFIAAAQAYEAAISAAEGMAECGVATFTATDGRTAIAAAANYQRKLEEANRLISGKKYSEAILQYETARSYYLSQQVNKYGLDHISLFNFAVKHPDQPFTAAVVGFYANEGEEQASIQLLSLLLEKGYRKGKTRKVQQQLGKQLALKDVQQGQTGEAKILSVKYSQNNRDLKKLKKAYEKERKRLGKR